MLKLPSTVLTDALIPGVYAIRSVETVDDQTVRLHCTTMKHQRTYAIDFETTVDLAAQLLRHVNETEPALNGAGVMHVPRVIVEEISSDQKPKRRRTPKTSPEAVPVPDMIHVSTETLLPKRRRRRLRKAIGAQT
jgi:hypothetical protein